MTRRCSHCSNNGHNSRTCPTRSSAPGGGAAAGGVRLFGVRLTDGSIMKKSASMGNLSAHYHSSSSAAASPNPSSPSPDPVHAADGYLSDDPAHASSDRRGERKKGVPWTEEEHRLFLVGLQKLGKGDWRGIARNFVVSRTPTQVASHAQKYFIRQSNATRRKRRSSLFDMAPDVATEQPPVLEEQVLLPPPPPHTKESDNINTDYSLPSLNLSLNSEFQPMDATSQEPEENSGEASRFQQVGPGFYPGYLPVPYPIWMPNAAPPPDNGKGTEISHHQVLKPIPIHSKEPVNVDELVGMSQLSIGDAKNAPSLSLNILGEPSRQSAFHASAPASGSGLGNEKSKSVVQAV